MIGARNSAVHIGSALFGWTLLAVLLFGAVPAGAETIAPLPKWEKIQLEADKDERKAWWQSLDAQDLRIFLDAGADVNLANHRNWTPLHSAARYSTDPVIVATLIEAGAGVNSTDRAGDTPLHWAAAENTNPAVLQALIEAGADVNARDRYGWQPLHTAAEGNPNIEIIETLLEAGAQTNKRAYFMFFKPRFLLKHNANMPEGDRERALALLD